MAAKSGTRGLFKNHVRGCRHARAKRLTLCDCAFRGKYKGQNVCLAVWSGAAVDPRELTDARVVFGRMKTAIDDHRFDPAGEIPLAAADDQTLAAFCDEYQTHHLDANHKRSKATADMLGVVKRSTLGGRTLDDLASSPVLLDRWLTKTAKDRTWQPSTTVRYFELLRAVFNYGKRVKMGGTARVTMNPCDDVVPPVADQPEQFKQRPLADLEADLLEACDRLDADIRRAQQTRTKLTQATADAIRAAVEAGDVGRVVAQRYGVSPSVVSGIVNGHAWTPAAGTQGREMRRRLIVAFDAGPRKAEMLLTTTDHVAPMRFPGPDGQVVKGYVITLPAALTKGGATTGEPERLYVSSPRLIRVIEARLLQLKKHPAHRRAIFGREDGRPIKRFDKAYRRLFGLVGLTPGRAAGVVWHQTRHEFISRLADDPAITDKQQQLLARHKDGATTDRYRHTTDAALFAAASRIGRA